METPADGLEGWNECRDREWWVGFAPAEEYVTYRGLWGTWDGRTANSWRRGDTAGFSFTGNAFLLYFWMNRRDARLGRVRLLIDGQPAFRFPVINQRRARRRGWHLFFGKGLEGEPQHTVQLRHTRGRRVNLTGFNAFDLPPDHTCP